MLPIIDTPSRPVPPRRGVPRVRSDRRPRALPGVALPVEPATAAAIETRAKRRAASPLPPFSGIDAGAIPGHIRRALPRWTSRRAFLRTVHALAGTETLRTLCAEVGSGIAPTTWVATMTVLVRLADEAGELRASEAQIADVLGREVRTVRRARAVAAHLGLATEVYRGRNLSYEERMTLVREHGRHPQRGIPSVWQLGMCAPARRARLSTPTAGRWTRLRGFDHLPPKGAARSITHLWDLLTTAAADAAREAEAAPPPQRRRRGSALGIELLDHQRFIVGVSPGRLAGLLAPWEAGGWRGSDLAVLVIDEARRLGWDPSRPARAPLAALKVILEGIDPVADPTTAWAGELCTVCYLRPGRVRHLPLGDHSVCPTCWEHIRHPHDETETCTHPGCDHGWIEVEPAQDGWHRLLAKCPACHPGPRTG